MNKRNLLIPLLLSFSLLGCDLFESADTSNNSSNSNATDTSSTFVIPDDVELATDANYAFNFNSVTFSSDASAKSGTNFYTPDEFSLTFKEFRDAAEYDDPYSVSVTNILVIPVQFKDKATNSVCKNLKGGCDKVKEDIAKNFFGDPNVTGWESVSSFYYKSSYGKLKLKGTVSDWFTLDITVKEYEALARNNNYADPSYYVLRQAVSWYQNTYHNLSDFDLDNDNYVDAVWLVYDHNFDRNSDVWWAYTFWDYYNEESGLIANTYAWASVNFMYEGGYIKNGQQVPDAHTFIHETGHILGLDDYYTYDEKDAYGPCGGLAMMDYNIGDHDAYSKMLLGWTMPKVVTGNTTITINPFESSGDCILLRDSDWNGSALDEYLLIEFYTPTGLNYLDSTEKYTNGVGMFTIPGIKIYHIDSRLGLFKYNQSNGDYRFQEYVDSIGNLGYYDTVDIASSNTRSYAANGYTLIHLIESSGRNTFKNGEVATNDTLFTQGNVFDPNLFTALFSHFENGAAIFNDYSEIGYKISIDSITSKNATLTFTKLN